jgi:carboxylesterase type B
MSKGLFHQAISQSGTALNPWALMKTPIAQAQRLGRQLSCPIDSSRALTNCLKTRSARSIARTHIDYSKEVIGDRLALFAPTIERVNDSLAFLTDHPRVLLEQGKVANPVPWITGVNSEEGLIYAANAIKNETRRRLLNDNWRKISPIIFYFDDHPNQWNISNKVRDYYLKNGKISLDSLEDTTNMFSDREFFEGTHDSAKMQSKVAPVYLYYYKYRGKFGFGSLLLSTTGRSLPASLDAVISTTTTWFRSNVLRREKRHYGVCHADELPIFYNIPLLTREIFPGTEDYAFSQSVVKLWTTFAQRGKASSFRGVQWSQVKADDAPMQYLVLDDYPEMINEPFTERLKFWKSLNLST